MLSPDYLANFNPLHREGGDCSGEDGPVTISYFNPLHREGGDMERNYRATLGE